MIKIIIDAGHSRKKEGCLAKNKIIGEHEINLYQAQTLKNLLHLDFRVDIIDPDADNLSYIGYYAKSYDVLISIHDNSFDGKENYSECCVSEKYNKPLDHNVEIASKAAIAMGNNIGIPIYQGKGWPRGVMPSNLLVLNAAHRAGVKIAFLTEAFFLDYYMSVEAIRKTSQLAMIALAQVLKKELL